MTVIITLSFTSNRFGKKRSSMKEKLSKGAADPQAIPHTMGAVLVEAGRLTAPELLQKWKGKKTLKRRC